jgi:YTV
MCNLRVSSMRVRWMGFLAGMALAVLSTETASACSTCHRTPCVMVAAPAYQCVTEMVPYTVMKTRMRLDYQQLTETVMTRVPETTFVECQRVVCKPVFDTTTVQRTVVVCKPVYETTMVNQTITVCKPVSTTRQVTEYCMQATTQLVTVPVGGGCGLCGKPKAACGCQTVARTCYTPVPVVRDVVETRMVPEVQTRQIPVTRCRMVQEEKIENVPITHCRMVQEVVTEKIPVTRWRCEPKQVTRQVPVPVCETVAETCYRPVTRMVPACAPAATAQATAQASAAPSGQAGASGQN